MTIQRKAFCVYLTLSLVAVMLSPLCAVAEPTDYQLYVGTQKLQLDMPLQEVEGNFLVPFRSFAEALETMVSWNERDASVILRKGADTLQMWLNSQQYLWNGEERQLSYPVCMVNDRTMLPLKDIALCFGYHCDIDDVKRRIIVYQGDEPPLLPPELVFQSREYILQPDTGRDIVAILEANGHALTGIELNGQSLSSPAQYELVGSQLHLKKEFLRTLSPGSARFNIRFENGITVPAVIRILTKPHVVVPPDSVVPTDYQLYVDGVQKQSDMDILYNLDGAYYFPLRALCEALNLYVSYYDGETPEIVLQTSGKTATIPIWTSDYTVNGEVKMLETPVILVNDRTMLPTRAIAEEFGFRYSRDDDRHRIELTSADVQIQNINGEDITLADFVQAKSLSLTVKSKTSVTPVVIMACYDQSNRMISLQYQTVSLTPGLNQVELKLDSVTNTEKAGRVRFFIWDSLDGMHALSSMYEIWQ